MFPETVGSGHEVGRQVYAWAPSLGEEEQDGESASVAGRWAEAQPCVFSRGQSLGVCAKMGPINTTEDELIQAATAQGDRK